MNIIKSLCLLALAHSNFSGAMNPDPKHLRDKRHLGHRLLWACESDNLEKIEQLISEGADIEAKDSYERTPLTIAASFDHNEVCALLIRHNAQVNPKLTQYNITPLRIAAGMQNIALCYLLVNAIVKPLKQMPTATITFLGISKLRKSACLNLIGRDVCGMIGIKMRKAFENTAQEKQNLLAQIEQIWRADISLELRDYVKQYLKPHK